MQRLTFWMISVLLMTSTALGGEKPNILFLFADDMCFQTIHALGHTDIDTPNLDRLASQGTLFTHSYIMGSWTGAVCIPSRTMLVTGRNLWRAQALYNDTAKELEAGRFWPILMREAGYKTYFSGKWHIRADASQAFDVARHIRAGMPKDQPDCYGRPVDGQPDPWSPTDRTRGGYWEGGRHWSEVTADDAIDFLDLAQQDRKPFFMYVAFNASHDPRQAPEEYLARYPVDRIQVPETFLPQYPYKDDIGCPSTLRDERLGPFPRTEYAVKVHRREYYALITHLDAQIGRVVAALEKSGLARNTWIFFTADNGLAVGQHGLFGKQNMHEHSTRVPFLVVGPKAPKGKKIDAPIYLQDVMPTALELAGRSVPAWVDFRSLLPLIEGRTDQPPHPAVYNAYMDLQRAVTFEGYKLILYPKPHVARLYNLRTDPQELHDVAADPSLTATKKQLFARLLNLQRELGDQLDLRAAFPDL